MSFLTPIGYHRHVPIWRTEGGQYWTAVRGGRFGRETTHRSLDALKRKIDAQLAREEVSVRYTPQGEHVTEEETEP